MILILGGIVWWVLRIYRNLFLEYDQKNFHCLRCHPLGMYFFCLHGNTLTRDIVIIFGNDFGHNNLSITFAFPWPHDNAWQHMATHGNTLTRDIVIIFGNDFGHNNLSTTVAFPID